MRKLLLPVLWLLLLPLLLQLPLTDLRLPLLLWWCVLALLGGAVLPLTDAVLVAVPLLTLLLWQAASLLPLLLPLLIKLAVLWLALLVFAGWLAGGMRRVLARRRAEMAERAEEMAAE